MSGPGQALLVYSPTASHRGEWLFLLVFNPHHLYPCVHYLYHTPASTSVSSDSLRKLLNRTGPKSAKFQPIAAEIVRLVSG